MLKSGNYQTLILNSVQEKLNGSLFAVIYGIGAYGRVPLTIRYPSFRQQLSPFRIVYSGVAAR